MVKDGKTNTSSATPVSDRAHILNKDSLDQKALQGPGSLDAKKLAPIAVADARRWLAKRGIEMMLPDGWRFMGLQLDGKAISFNHSGTAEGHSVDVSTWKLAEDTPLEKFLQPYLDDVEELVRLGRLAGHEKRKLGDADGVLLIGWGPDSKEALAEAQSSDKGTEELFLATDGTGRRVMSWRGAIKRAGESTLLIVSFSSPIESFMEARPVYDAIVASARIIT